MLNQFPDHPSNPVPVRKDVQPSPPSPRETSRKEDPKFRRVLDKEGQKDSVQVEEDKDSRSIFDLSKDQSKSERLSKKKTQDKQQLPPADSSDDSSKIKKALPSPTEEPSQEILPEESYQKNTELSPREPKDLPTPFGLPSKKESAEAPSPEQLTSLEKPLKKEEATPSPSSSPRTIVADSEKNLAKSSHLPLSNQQEGRIEGEEGRETSVANKKEKSSSSISSISSSEPSKETSSSHPVIQNVQFETTTSSLQSSPEASRSSPVKELVNKMIEQIQIMKRDDLTSTRVTLQSPPLLEGVTLTLESSTHAQKEFNVSFGNLSHEGQLFLDRKLKENSLTDAMNEAGYVVHIVTTTTEDRSLFQEGKQENPQERDQQQPKDQRRQPFRGWEEPEQ